MVGTTIPGEPEGSPYTCGLPSYGSDNKIITLGANVSVTDTFVVARGGIGVMHGIVVGDKTRVVDTLTGGLVWDATITSISGSVIFVTPAAPRTMALIGDVLQIFQENANNFDSSTLDTSMQVGHSEQLLICDRTGFKIPVREGLREEWTGRKVRKQSFEVRHPQDYLRSRAEKQKGSDRPEQDDQDIANLYPTTGGVQVSDL